MYTFTFRNSLHPSLASFDAPDAISACTRRLRSNTPLQALNLLNDTAWIEFSRALAARVLRDAPGGGDDRARLAYAFRLATSRVPAADELAILASLLEKKRAELRAEPEHAAAIVDKGTPPDGVATSDFAAWTLVARTILNLDETITRE
jgi:hypothetical protein